jgi:hypothetical protein
VSSRGWALAQWVLAAGLIAALVIVASPPLAHGFRQGVYFGALFVGPGLAVSLVINGIVAVVRPIRPAARWLIVGEFVLVAAEVAICAVDRATYEPDGTVGSGVFIGPLFGLHIIAWFLAVILGISVLVLSLRGVRSSAR